jgi:hypothetical protein
MRIYFHVCKIEKDECEFVFTYLKNDEHDISGRATVQLNVCPVNITFDTDSEMLLCEKEKRSIISEVLTNIKL